MSLVDFLVIEHLTIGSGDTPYTVPARCRSIAISNPGSNVAYFATSDGGVTWTLAAGAKEDISCPDLANGKLHFTGTQGDVIELRTLKSVTPR